MTAGAVILAVLGAIASLLGIVAHKRAVITAEQRGRIEEIERQQAARAGVAPAVEREIKIGEDSARAAERSVRGDAVTRAEVQDWMLPPGEEN